MVNGMLWIDRPGAAGRDMPERYGQWTSEASRFYRWRKAGVWQTVLEAVQGAAQADGKINWEVHFVDASLIRAHQHAAGAKKAAHKPKR